MRIVSLIASATEIVHALGLGPHQVGRSHECDYPDEVARLPVCTRPAFPVDGGSREIDRQVKQRLRSAASIYEIFTEVVRELAPTHILTQTQCKVCAVSQDVERELCGLLPSRPRIVALEPDCLDGIWKDIAKVAGACGIPERGRALTESLQSRMWEISREAAKASKRPRVVCLEWVEPPMAAGNWIPELIDLAGGINLLGAAGRHSPYLEWGDVLQADPDVLLVAPCGFGLERTEIEMHWLKHRPGWPNLRAVRDGRVYRMDANQYMTRPGPRVVESQRALAEIFHPQRFEPTLEGRAWVCPPRS